MREFINDLLSNSEIAKDSLAYEEIFRGLQAIQVPIANSNCDVKRIPKRQFAEIRKLVSKILQSADTGQYCQNYAVDVVVVGAKANLFHQFREGV